jgi:hypothetical protein
MPTRRFASETTPNLAELALALAQSLPALGRRHFPIFLAIGVTALLSGCESISASASNEYYKPPAAARTDLASLQGCQTSSKQPFDEAEMAYVALIDSMSVSDPKGTCSQPIALIPGPHTINVDYQYANFNARTNLHFEAKAGAAYQLKVQRQSEGPDAPLYCDFWIVDLASSQPVTPVIHVRASAKVFHSIFGA